METAVTVTFVITMFSLKNRDGWKTIVITGVWVIFNAVYCLSISRYFIETVSLVYHSNLPRCLDQIMLHLGYCRLVVSNPQITINLLYNILFNP